MNTKSHKDVKLVYIQNVTFHHNLFKSVKVGPTKCYGQVLYLETNILKVFFCRKGRNLFIILQTVEANTLF